MRARARPPPPPSLCISALPPLPAPLAAPCAHTLTLTLAGARQANTSPTYAPRLPSPLLPLPSWCCLIHFIHALTPTARGGGAGLDINRQQKATRYTETEATFSAASKKTPKPGVEVPTLILGASACLLSPDCQPDSSARARYKPDSPDIAAKPSW